MVERENDYLIEEDNNVKQNHNGSMGILGLTLDGLCKGSILCRSLIRNKT